MERGSGVLLHISSLPSKYGIGTFGDEAFRFVDFLVETKQKYWQILPLTPTGYGDSPYQSFSTFALNPYFIDLDMLVRQGLITKKQINALFWGNDKSKVDYGAIYISKDIILRQAFEKADKKLLNKVKQFAKQQPWLEDYSLFITLKKLHGGVEVRSWAEPYVKRDPAYIAKIKSKHKDEINYQCFVQYLAYTQYIALKKYANCKDIKIIGDMPIYISEDSSDVWCNPQSFYVDELLTPSVVAGVPPDYFSATGQLWGNPLYNYDYMKQNGYKFWCDRFAGYAKLYDVTRIDHFRAFEAYYSIPYGEQTALNGNWVKVDGIDLFEKAAAPQNISIIAEDLGIITDEVVKLRNALGFPGMKVLCFAFSQKGDTEHEYKPKNYPKNCIAYINTHDNDTLMGFIDKGGEAYENALEYYGLNLGENQKIYSKILKDICDSKADTVILCMQDLLKLGTEARMNIPCSKEGNWQFRLADRNYLRKASFLKKLTISAKR